MTHPLDRPPGDRRWRARTTKPRCPGCLGRELELAKLRELLANTGSGAELALRGQVAELVRELACLRAALADVRGRI